MSVNYEPEEVTLTTREVARFLRRRGSEVFVRVPAGDGACPVLVRATKGGLAEALRAGKVHAIKVEFVRRKHNGPVLRVLEIIGPKTTEGRKR